MKYCAINIEATGLDPNTCNIIEFAAVVDDFSEHKLIESLPVYQTYIVYDTYTGDPYALAMHVEIFKKLSTWKKDTEIKVCRPDDLFRNLHTFLINCGYKSIDGKIKINVAGKNFSSFDKKFLDKLENNCIEFHHRSLDPSILYFDPLIDETLPSTEVCLKRAGMDSFIAHTALADAKAIIELLRKKIVPDPAWDFTIILEGLYDLDFMEDSAAVGQDIFSKIYDSGCFDGTIGCSNGEVFMDFTRKSPTRELAIESAISDLKKVGLSPKLK
jgi:hypothetical protein